MEFDEKNGSRKVYNIDMDGVLTNGEFFWKTEPTPNLKVIEAVRNLYKAGNIIIIWSARAWEMAPETVGWLIKNRVPFHGVYMSKGGSDCYVDDKNISVDDLLRKFLNDRS